jgi:hypothetical protein
MVIVVLKLCHHEPHPFAAPAAAEICAKTAHVEPCRRHPQYQPGCRIALALRTSLGSCPRAYKGTDKIASSKDTGD